MFLYYSSFLLEDLLIYQTIYIYLLPLVRRITEHRLIEIEPSNDDGDVRGGGLGEYIPTCYRACNLLNDDKRSFLNDKLSNVDNNFPLT